MALPTAQLGQLSSINLPNYAPSSQKRPSIWSGVLANILASAGTNAADSVASNEFSRDYATQQGQDEATGWDKLLHGPTVNAQQNAQLNSEAAAREQLATKDQFDTEHEQEQQAFQQGLHADTEKGATMRAEQERNTQLGINADNLDRSLALSDQTQQGDTQRQAALLTAEAPTRQATADYQKSEMAKNAAQMEGISIQNQLLRNALPKPATAATVNPNIAKFAAGGASPQPSGGGVVPGSDTQSAEDSVQSMLNSGMSPAQVQQILMKQSQVQDSAQVQGQIDDRELAARKAAAAQLMQKLGLNSNDPFAPPVGPY